MNRCLLLCCLLLQSLLPKNAKAQLPPLFTTYSMGGANSAAFTTNNFKCIAVGKGNIVWAGTQYGGLYLYNDTLNIWRKSSLLTDVNFVDMKADPDSGIWVAQSGLQNSGNTQNTNIAGGVNYFPSLGDVGMNFYSVTGTTTGAGLLSRHVRSLYLDPAYKAGMNRRPRPWVAMGTYITSNVTRRGGINLGLSYEQPYFSTIREGFASVFVTSATPICEAVGGSGKEVWVASRLNQGGSKLLRYSPSGNYLGFHNEANLPAVFSAGFAAQAIFFDKFGNRWVGLKQGGLRVFKPDSTWVKMDATSFFTASTQVNFNAITEDEFGTVYIGTSDGLLEYQSQDYYPLASPDYLPSYKQYTTNDGLPSNNITGLAYDKKNGRVLITTPGGVTFMNIKEQFIKGVVSNVYCNLDKENAVPGLQRKPLVNGVRVTLLKNGVEEETTTPNALGVFELKNANETDTYTVEVRYNDGSRAMTYRYNNIRNHKRMEPTLMPDSLIKELKAYKDGMKLRGFPLKLAYGNLQIPPELFKVVAFDVADYEAPIEAFYNPAGITADHMKRVNNLANYYAAMATVYGVGGDMVELSNDGIANLLDVMEGLFGIYGIHKDLKKQPHPNPGVEFDAMLLSSFVAGLNTFKTAVIYPMTKAIGLLPEKHKKIKEGCELSLSVLEGSIDALLAAVAEQDNNAAVMKVLVDNAKKIMTSFSAALLYGQYYAQEVHKNFVPNSAAAAASLQSPFTYLEVKDNLLDTLTASITRASRDTTKFYKGYIETLGGIAKAADFAANVADMGTFLAAIPGAQGIAGACKTLSNFAKGTKIVAVGSAAFLGFKGAGDVVDLSEESRPKAGLARMAASPVQPYGRLQGAGDSLLIRRTNYVQSLTDLQALYTAPGSYTAPLFNTRFGAFRLADSLYALELDKSLNRLWSARDSGRTQVLGFDARLDKILDNFVSNQSAFRQAFFYQNIGYTFTSNRSDFTAGLDSLCNQLKTNTDSLVNGVVALLDTVSARAVPSLANLVKDDYKVVHSRVPGTSGTLTYRFTNYGSVAQNNVRFKISRPTGGYTITSADSVNIGIVQPGQTVQVTYNFTAPAVDSMGTYIIDVMADNGLYRDVSGTLYVIDPTKIYTVKNGDWSDPSIWNTGAVPTSANKVFIYHSVTVTTDVNSKQVEIYRPGNVVVKPGKKVNLNL